MVSEEEFQEAFSLFDRDGVGSVTYADVGKTVRSLGFNPTQAELATWLKQVDNSNRYGPSLWSVDMSCEEDLLHFGRNNTVES